MDDADRFRLLGKYRTPRFRIGQRVRCLVRREMIVTGMTDAPIPRRGEGSHVRFMPSRPSAKHTLASPPAKRRDGG
jgi:hypothetical protein